MPSRVLNILIENFEIDEDVVARTDGRMGYGDWSALTRLHRPRLKDLPFSPHTIWAADDEGIFDAIQERDRLVHHPFESFSSVEAFLRVAVDDPSVIAIKITLYRIGPDSPLLDLLIRAAEAGKQVAVLVELKARFDERNNIVWANRLESAGVHVVYGDGEPEDALQTLPGGAQGTGGHRPVRAYRDRELQPGDVKHLHRLRPVHGAAQRRGRGDRGLQLSDRLFEQVGLLRAAGGAASSAQGVHRPGRARGGACARRPRGRDNRQEQLGRGSRDDPRPLPRLPRPAFRST